MTLFDNIHWLDMTIVGLVGCGAIIGACKGLAHMVIRMLIYVAALYASVILHAPVAGFLARRLPLETPPQLVIGLAFVGVFLSVALGLSLAWYFLAKGYQSLTRAALGDAAQAIRPGMTLRILDHIGGAGLGAMLAGLMAGALVWGLSYVNDADFQTNLAGSKLRPVVLKQVDAVLAVIPERYKDELHQAIERLRLSTLSMVSSAEL